VLGVHREALVEPEVLGVRVGDQVAGPRVRELVREQYGNDGGIVSTSKRSQSYGPNSSSAARIMSPTPANS